MSSQCFAVELITILLFFFLLLLLRHLHAVFASPAFGTAISPVHSNKTVTTAVTEALVVAAVATKLKLLLLLALVVINLSF